jgi:leader peptidase (prepilin peptidase) / N-methyltransferase
MIFLLVAVTGVTLGSFLNCLISRLKINRKGWRQIEQGKKRSVCDSCGHQLPWYDLIPVISFLILGGRCRFCQERIPIYNLLVELVAGLLAIGIYQKLGLSFLSVGYLLISLVLLGILVYDWQKKLIPDFFIWVGVIIAIILQLFRLIGGEVTIPTLFWGLAIGGGIFYLLHFFSKGRWIGFGDVKLGALLGLALGWPLIGVGLWIGFVIGGLVGAGLLLTGKKKLTSQIPFGPFLIVGFWIVLFYGQVILEIAKIYFSL